MDELEARIRPERVDVFLFAAAEIVKHQDFVTVRQQGSGEIRADATCSACNEDSLAHSAKLAGNQVVVSRGRVRIAAACTTSVLLKVRKLAMTSSSPVTARYWLRLMTTGSLSPE